MKELWVDKYSPKTLADYVFRDSALRVRCEQWIKEGVLPHLLLSGSPGVGKSTLARVLLNELNITRGDRLWINASHENDVDTMRQKVTNFASTVPFGDYDYKYVILDECLDADEEILTPTGTIRLGDMHPEELYELLSFNMKNGSVESDYGEVVSIKEDDVYEIELVDGRVIRTTLDHPFLVKNDMGEIIQRKLANILPGDEIISI